LTVVVRDHGRTLEGQRELLREPRRLALGQDDEARLDPIAPFELKRETRSLTRQRLDPSPVELGPEGRHLLAGALLKLAAVHVSHAQVVADLRKVHGGLVLTVHGHRQSIFGQEQRGAEPTVVTPPQRVMDARADRVAQVAGSAVSRQPGRGARSVVAQARPLTTWPIESRIAEVRRRVARYDEASRWCSSDIQPWLWWSGRRQP
jgi:hypothetical protein